MARNATPNDTALQQALKKLRSIKANPQLTATRTVAPTSHKMAVEPVAIDKFLTFIQTVEPIVVQRNDLFRLSHGMAKHLEELALPQCVFGLVYLNRKFYLVDGNTRKRSWLTHTLSTLPSTVWVAVMVIDSEEEGKRIYGCYDSKQAKKTNRDDLLSMMHNAGVKPETLKSSVVAGGKLVSVISNIARAMSGGSASPKRKQEVVNAHLFCFRELDKLMLNDGELRGGALWAGLRLYRQVPREFFSYIDSYLLELKMVETPLAHTVDASVVETAALALRQCRKYQVGTSGEKPIPVMFPVYLEGFYRWSKAQVNAGKTTAKFRSFVSKMMKDIISPDIERALHLLPEIDNSLV